jgi:levansucrase
MPGVLLPQAADASPDAGPVRWSPPRSGEFVTHATGIAPLITPECLARVAEGIDIWDAWPLQQPDGAVADLGAGRHLWMALGAPRFPDPDERHAHARIHLLLRTGDVWQHLGPAMPDGFSPGSREWSGSAVLDEVTGAVTLYFTATGQRGEAVPTFLQRLFTATATLVLRDRPALTDWRDLCELVERDAAHYMASDEGTGTVGTIKAFRDPAFFRDPVDGSSHVLFAASAAGSASAYNGVVGLASAVDGQWQILPPIVSADGLNNELERPHVVFRQGLYYLFWSTQRHVFDPAGPIGPTGLYGMVASTLRGGDWQPLNGTGLVFGNPPQAPAQAYSWLVMPDLAVTSFVDDWGRDEDKETRNFGGTFAPFLELELDGNRARLVSGR